MMIVGVVVGIVAVWAVIVAVSRHQTGGRVAADPVNLSDDALHERLAVLSATALADPGSVAAGDAAIEWVHLDAERVRRGDVAAEYRRRVDAAMQRLGDGNG